MKIAVQFDLEIKWVEYEKEECPSESIAQVKEDFPEFVKITPTMLESTASNVLYFISAFKWTHIWEQYAPRGPVTPEMYSTLTTICTGWICALVLSILI